MAKQAHGAAAETPAEAQAQRQRDKTLANLAHPAAQAAHGAAQIGRRPLFLSVLQKSFSAPRSLEVSIPEAKSGTLHPGTGPPRTDPAEARSAYASAAVLSEALFNRILAAANQVARDADRQLEALTDRNEGQLQQALALLNDDHSKCLLDAANKRDQVLERIASRSDVLRGYVVDGANGAIGRMGALRSELLSTIETLKAPVIKAKGALDKALGAARTAGEGAQEGLDNLQHNRMSEFRKSGKFSTAEHRGTAMVEAMLDAAEHYGPSRVTADMDALKARLKAVESFALPISACGICEADGKLQGVQAHADNLGVAGPKAIRSARDGALKSIDETERALTLSVLEAHRQTENGLVERQNETRRSLIGQSTEATAGLRRDLDHSTRQQIDALTGVAATQPAALKMVHSEVEKSASASPSRTAELAVEASERLKRNVANVGERHPVGILGAAERNRVDRFGKAMAGGREQLIFVGGFAEQQQKFIRESFDQVTLSIEESLFDLEELPGKVGKSCDSMLRSAQEAVGKAKKTIPKQIAFIAQKLTDACDGLIPLPPESTTANPQAAHEPPPQSLVCSAADEPNASLFDPGSASMLSSSPQMSFAPQTTGAAPTSQSTAAPTGTGPVGKTAPPPASCGDCDSARAAAREGSGAGSGTQSGDSSTAGANASSGATQSRSGGGGDVGVSSANTDYRSPNSYRDRANGIKARPVSAPNVDAFLDQVLKNVTDTIGTERAAARGAILRTGETDYPTLMGVLRGLSPLQADALKESYLDNYGSDLASDITIHAYDGFLSGITSTADYNRDAALAALRGNPGAAAMLELQAAFNFSNETDRIFNVMTSMTQEQMRDFVSQNRKDLEDLMTQLSDEDQARFRLLMDGNTVRARSTELRSSIDNINQRYAYGNQRDQRGFALGTAIGSAENAQRWALEGPSDRVDIYHLEDPKARAEREQQHWADIQRDFGTLDGVAEAIANSSPTAAVSRPDDPPGAALLAYASRPLEAYRVYSTEQREGESRDAALDRQRIEYQQWGVTLGAEQTGEYGPYRVATTSLSDYQKLYLQMVVTKGSQSREARAARTLAQFRRSDGQPPDYKDVEESLHSGAADAREGGNFEHGSREEAERDRLKTFAQAEQFRRQIEGGASGPVDAEQAKASFRREMEEAYRNRPDDLDVALGVIDSDAGNMQAIIDQAITREDPALLTRYLGRMDSKQIEDMVIEWNKRHRDGPGLLERLGLFQHHWSITNMNGAVFTGDEANSLEIAFMGVPQTPKQRGEVALRILNQQIEQSGWMGRLLCSDEYDDLVDQARHLRDVMGVKDGDVDEEGRIRLVDQDGNAVHVNFDANGQFRPAPGQEAGEFEMLVVSSRLVADNYANAVDRMASILTTVIAIVGAIVLTIATFGAGASVLLAMGIAAGFGALTIWVNASMRGGRYSRDDLTRDVVAAAVQIATAGLNVGIARGLAAGGALAAEAGEVAGRTLSLSERLLVTASRNALATQMITQGAIGGMSNLASTALDPAMRRRDDYSDEVMHSFFRGFAGGAVTAGVAHGLSTGATAALERYAGARAAALAIESGASKEAAARLAAMSAAKMANGPIMSVAVRSLVNATSATAGRATELEYERLMGIRQHNAGDFYRELRGAFVQNAIQGIGEGAALSRTRGVLASHSEQNARELESVRMGAAAAAESAFDREMARHGIGPEGQVSSAEPSAPPPRPATPDDAVRLASEEARGTRPVGEDQAAVARAITEESAGTTMTRGRQPIDEAGIAIRPAGEDEVLRSNIPRSERDTLPELPSVKPAMAEETRPLTFAELVAKPAGAASGQRVVDTVDLTPEMLSSAHSLPEESIIRASDPRDPVAAERNYRFMRERDPHREVLLAFHPETGEYAVVQGGMDSVRKPPGGGWVAERHSHPRTYFVNDQAAILHALPSGKPGDFGALISEAQALAARPERGGVAVRASKIDIIQSDGSVTETTFAVMLQDQKMELMVTFRDPAGSERQLGPYSNLAEYGAEVLRLTGTDILAPARPAPEGTYNLPDTRRSAPVSADDLAAARFVAERLGTTSERRGPVPELAVPPERQEAPFSAAAEEVHAAIRKLGLVGAPDSLSRLTALLNVEDPSFTPTMRAALANAALEATRAELIRTGQLEPGDDVLLLFRGVTRERLADYEREGMNLSKLGPGKDEDASRGLYGSQDFESALRYTGEGSGGMVLPLLVRRSELGNVIDVRSGTPLGGRWLEFLRASQGKGRLWPEHGHLRGVLDPRIDLPIALERDARGLRYEAFLRSVAEDPTLPESVRSAARDRHLTLMDLGGVASTGNDRGILTDQWAMHSQHIADLFNEAHGFPTPSREIPSTIHVSVEETEVMRSNISASREPAPPGFDHFDRALDLALEHSTKAVGPKLLAAIPRLEIDLKRETIARYVLEPTRAGRVAAADAIALRLAAQDVEPARIRGILRELNAFEAQVGDRARVTAQHLEAGVADILPSVSPRLASAVADSSALAAFARRNPQLFAELEARYFKDNAARSRSARDVERSFVARLRGQARSKKSGTAAREILEELTPLLPKILDFKAGLRAAISAERGAADFEPSRFANRPDPNFEGRIPLLAQDHAVEPGMRVDDYNRGRGTVLRVDGDTVEILFSSFGRDEVQQIRLSALDTFPAWNSQADAVVPFVPFRDASEQKTAQAQIDSIRTREHLPAYAVENGAGTVSIARAGGIETVGTNSTLAARMVTTTHAERSELMTLLRRVGLDPTNTTRDPRFVHHAEIASLFDLRSALRRSGQPIAEVVELFVDRETCNSCVENLSLVASYLGVAELRIYTRDQPVGSLPLIIRSR